MSRIGKKPIEIPKGVTVKVEDGMVAVQGPKGKLDTALPAGIRVEQKDGHLLAIRENDSQSAVHGLARALVNNAVEGVTKGWTRDLEIVGIGYRAEMKGKGMIVFNLGYSHPIEYPAADRCGCHRGSEADQDRADGYRPSEGRTGGGGNALAASTRSLQEQGRPLCGRAAEEEGR